MTEMDIPAAREIALRVLDPNRMPDLLESEAVLRLFLEITDPAPVTPEFCESSGMRPQRPFGSLYDSGHRVLVTVPPGEPLLWTERINVGLVRHALAIEPK